MDNISSASSLQTTGTPVSREDENANQSLLTNDQMLTKTSTTSNNEGKKRDQTKAGKVERRARRLFNAGNNLSLEESRKQAFKQITEERRVYAERQRMNLKEKGLKRNKSRKQGYGNKNESIARKIVAILKEKNNGIYRHEIAKQKAEEWYSRSTSARSAKYRRKKKLLKEQNRQ